MKFFFLAPVLLLAGCRNPAPGYTPVPPVEVATTSMDSIKNARDLMPLGVGNHWAYALRVQNFDKDDKPQPEVQGKIDIDIASRWPNGTGVLVVSQNGSVVDRQAWFGDATGLYQVEGSVEGAPFRPTLPLFTLPLKSGKRFQWRGRGPVPEGGIAQSSAECEILAPQNVDLSKGSVSAIPVVSRLSYPKSEMVTTSWFQPGVGLVRMYQEVKSKGKRSVQILTLIDHTTKSR